MKKTASRLDAEEMRFLRALSQEGISAGTLKGLVSDKPRMRRV